MASSEFVRVPTGLIRRDLIGRVEIRAAIDAEWSVIIHSRDSDPIQLASFKILPHAEGPLLADIGQFEGTPYAEPAPADEPVTRSENLFDCADVPDQFAVLSEMFDRWFPGPSGRSPIVEVLGALARAHTAMRLTHEYAGAMFLPALPGWSWWDSTQEIDEILRRYRAPGQS